MFKKYLRLIILSWLVLFSFTLFAHDSKANETPTVSPILPGASLPFKIEIDLFSQSLPQGFHSGAGATWEDKWLFIAGRTNGMHGFNDDNQNFPIQQQNINVIVIDIKSGFASSKSLYNPDACLSQIEVDSLSVTSPQSYQRGDTLYMTGGYGVNTLTGEFSTKDVLSVIHIPGLIHWVLNPSSDESAKEHIRQISDPIFKITGGTMHELEDNTTLLVFGQNFQGFYNPGSDGDYSKQVRRFKIIDKGFELSIKTLRPKPKYKEENYRRRDLNIVPAICCEHGEPVPYLVALSGVFTLTGGAWTIPVIIDRSGKPSTFSSLDTATFKQGMNNYASATVGLFSAATQDMFTTLFGGISFGYFNGTTFITDPQLPFINQVTTIARNADGDFAQYLMAASFPTILSTTINPGNTLLFGAGAEFFLDLSIKHYSNGVIDFDALPDHPLTIGYIVGGIESTLPNTNTKADSSASDKIFRVRLTKNFS